MKNIGKLKQHWQQLTEKYCFNPIVIDDVYDEICKQYSESHRHYHTLDHLEQLFSLFTERSGKMDNPDIVAFAIWFHDFIYNPRREDNEEQSALKAGVFLREIGLEDYVIRRIQKLILWTGNHFQLIDKDDRDTAFFLDLDLSILGSENIRYRHYMEQVRDEYVFIPFREYRKGRIKLLKRYLFVKSIFKTAYFQRRFEQQARSNIQYEIAFLESHHE